MTASRSDTNQPEIVATLRGMGCTVQHLHDVGRGVPDLLVGLRGINLLVEVKKEHGTLNPIQIAWHNHWRGQVAVVHNSEQAAALVRDVFCFAVPIPTQTSKSKWHGHSQPETQTP